MQHQTIDATTVTPLRPARVLIEDPNVELDSCSPAALSCFEVTWCAGPASETEECPLVMDGRCPLGEFDVVVGALDGPWARSVRAAWAQTGVPYAAIAPDEAASADERLAHHVGAALAALWAGR